MFRIVLTLGLLLVVCTGAIAGATQRSQELGRWERQVRDYLRRAGETLETRGYELTHQTYTGSLSDGESESLTVSLETRAGGYEIVGVCDADCSDLDLELFDLYGNPLDDDIGSNDTPVVSVRPSQRARYRLEISMADCSPSPCWYGIGIFGRAGVLAGQNQGVTSDQPIVHLIQQR